ncbi:uncharacterized protein LOC132256264 [Phlebotomus argentipes]|uniref:uncharacterized protein LOC132256264 n=1 Tax=Phlebotomus argentipes TaxID=94469 RepID=UPI002892FD8E|nr:uncharacterized protein LOC132256264 [Phlebotomus argentipes]
MENPRPEGPENGIFGQQFPRENLMDTAPVRGFSINGFGLLDLTHHIENDTVMSTSSSASGGLVIDHDLDAEPQENCTEVAKKSTISSNGRPEVFPTPQPKRRSSVWSAEKSLVVSNTRDYSQYLGMQPSVKFKCYKCLESNFTTLRHLKEHQQICLTQKTTTPDVVNGPNGRRINGEYKAPTAEDPNTKVRISRKVFLCSACGTYYENFNLFLHMREVHRKHICLLCLGMFPSAERLHQHLEGRHGILSADLNTPDTLQSQLNSQLFYLMCVTCEHIFTEHDHFVGHNCDTFLQPCNLCHLRGSHRPNCKASASEVKPKRNGQATVEPPQQKVAEAHVPEPPDPIGELWKRYLNGDAAAEGRTETQPVAGEVTSTVQECEPRLLVPKLKVKIPKEFQTKLNSPVSSSSSEAESEEGEEANKSSEMSEEVTPQDESASHCVKEELEKPEQPQQPMEVQQQPPEQQESNVPDAPQAAIEGCQSSAAMEKEIEKVKAEPKPAEEEDEEDEDGIVIAKKDAQMFDLRLNQPLDRIDMVDLLRICLKHTIPICLYCNHTTRIVVNAKYLALHLIGTHRFSATVDSITAEELLPETIVARVKRSLEELEGVYINLETFDSRDADKALAKPCDRSFHCFQCRLTAKIHKELYQHNRKMHMKTVILCLMCKSALYSYSELLYHMCPGYTSTAAELRFRCGFCSLHNIPSAFRLMVHLRKRHGICEICLEDCGDQFKLSNHVWKHKLQHLCFRCGIVYRNKPDITKHLFWKHGTESVTCKKCLQKKWPLVYHFCTPPAQFTCEHCPQIFTRAVSLTVHRRVHTGDLKYACEEENCDKKFISKKLLEKHTLKHSQFIADEPVFIGAEEKHTPAEVEKETAVVEKDEQAAGVTEKSDKGEKKVKKSKKREVDLMDIDLPAPNLSESDSDMDVDKEDSTDVVVVKEVVPQEAPVELPKPADVEEKDKTEEEEEEVKTKPVPMDVEEEEEKAAPVEGIWENFKTYQTLQQQASKVEDEEEAEKDDGEVSVPILHVSQSDHDYCSIYKVAGKGKPEETDVKPALEKPQAVVKSDSSDSSSDSGSSCTCESNCSCSSSSSSGSSSTSSSSSDEDDAKNPGERKRKRLKRRDKGASREMKEESKVNPNVIDVVTVEKGQEGDENYEVFYESDLVTDESETDEDFYDEHPQKIAREMMMAWNRKFDDESREDGTMAADEAEEEVPMKREKPVKVKRKKKEKRHQKLPPLKLSLPPVAPILTAALMASTPLVSSSLTPGTPSSATMSEMSASGVKRSKRRRIPNKFYGYSSDEETTGGSNSNTPHPPAVLKPIQPPNLVWCKEDLPQSSGNAKMRSPSFQSLLMAKKSSPSSDFATYNVQPPAQLPPQIFASTSPAPKESTPTVQPLRLPIPPVVPVNRSYSDMAEVQTSGEAPASGSGEEGEEEEEEESESSDASHLEIRDSTANRMSFPGQPEARKAAPEEKPADNVYCYCRCPYDEVSEMIACDGENCAIEWFHFECVGIMVPPVGKWYCPQCKLKQENAAAAYY